MDWLKWELPQYWEIVGQQRIQTKLGQEKIWTTESTKNTNYWAKKKYK